MRDEPGSAGGDAEPCSGLRTILVPPDIIPVKRCSPLPVRKRTPWHPRPDGDAITERAGGRDWFSDQLFCESQDGHERVGYGTSLAMHAGCVAVLTIVLITRPYQVVHVSAGSSLMMPAMTAMLPLGAGPAGTHASESTAPKPTLRPAAPPPAPGPAEDVKAAAPLEAPLTIEPESGIERGDGGVTGGADGGVEGGVPGGIVGGVPDGALSAGASLGPLRLGGGSGVRAPRKIKDVKPVYPQGALADQARGVVIIEAMIGIDGKVKETKVLRSIPLLDQAALDAVRQWEYAPSVLNGAPVAVIMTILVNFAIQ